MNEENCDIILDSTKGKAKGVLMPKKEDENIPQMVGISKLQLFFLILATIILGTGAFILGYIFHANKDNFSLEYIKNISEAKYNIGAPTNKTEKDYTSSEYIIKNFYIIVGKYQNIDEAKKVQNKLQIKAGKLATLKQIDERTILYIGPFESESLARNEKNLISQKCYIIGSITSEI